jgi:hypothetical protein
MTGRPSPTVRRRQLGIELRQLRIAKGLTTVEAAHRLDWYHAKVSRVETATITVHWGDVVELLDLYEVADGATRDSLIKLAKEARKRDWWQPYNDLLNKNLATFIGLESAAESLRGYQPTVVPGLIQTEAYARAVVQSGSILERQVEELDRLVRLRLDRQGAIAEQNSLRRWFVLHEAALFGAVGNSVVMSDQCKRLVEEARNPQVTIQVIPITTGAYPGTAGAFGVFRFPDEGHRDIAYADTVSGVLFLERKNDLKLANLAFDHLVATALSPIDSIQLIDRVALWHRSEGRDGYGHGFQPTRLEKSFAKQ